MCKIKLSPQQSRVLEYMKANGSITTLQAYNDLGIVCLPKRISELTRLGYLIINQSIEVFNRFGEKTHVSLYILGGVA